MKISTIFKDISIKNHTYYFFDDTIIIKEFDPNNIELNEKSYKNIFIYYITHVTIKDSNYVKINNITPLCLAFNKLNGYFEETNGNRYLTLFPTNGSNNRIKSMKNCRSKPEI